MGDTFTSGRWAVDYGDTFKRIYRDTAVTPTVVDDANQWQADIKNLFDEPAQMDNDIPVSAQTPTEFTFGGIENGQQDAPWFMDPRHVKYLQGGAIQTANWTRTEGSENGIMRILYDNTTDPVESDIGKAIVHDTDSDSGVLVGFDITEGWLFVRPDSDAIGNSFNSTSGTLSITAGTANVGAQTAAADTGEYLWANPNSVTVFSVQTGTRGYAYQDGSKITNWPASIGLNADGEFDVLVLVKASDVLIDNGFLTFFARRGGALGDWFEADLSNGGRVTIPLTGNPNATNDGTGHHNAAWTAGSGATLLVGEIVDLDADSETAAVVVNVTTPAGATGDFDYVLIRDLSQFVNTDAVTAVDSGKTMTITTPTDLAPVTDTGVTLTHAEVASGRDINNGNGARPYSIDLDPNSLSWERVYQRLQYITRRGSTDQIDGINGESYRGSTLQIEYDTQTGAFTEGLVLTGTTSGATGTIVADHDAGADGDLILRAVRGTFVDGEEITDTSTGDADVNGTPRSIPTLKFAPLGNLAGTLWQGSPGMVPVLANIASGREQDYTLIDDDGVVQSPPNTVSVGATSVAVDDWVTIFRLAAAFPGGAIDRNEYTSHATLNAITDTTFEVQSAISQEAPPAGVIHVVYDTDLEHRYNYDSWTGSIFTLTTVPDGTADATDATGITLTDTGAGDFIVDGVLPGMIVENTTDGSFGIVKSRTATTITLDGIGLTGGTGDDWAISDAYQINKLFQAYDGSDVVWVPFIDLKILTGTTVSTTIIQSVDIETIFRCRQGPGQIADDPIVPFVAGGQIGTNGQSSPAVRTSDTISP